MREGDRVKTGDALLEFDIDYVALHAKSLLTQIIVTNSDRVAQFDPHSGQVVAGKDIALELALEAAEEAVDRVGGEVVTSEPIAIGNPQGCTPVRQQYW